MRRDMDLIRDMLIASADADHPIPARGFVDAVRDPSVWHRVKRRIEHTVGSATFGTWASLAVKIASGELDG